MAQAARNVCSPPTPVWEESISGEDDLSGLLHIDPLLYHERERSSHIKNAVGRALFQEAFTSFPTKFGLFYVLNLNDVLVKKDNFESY